MKKLYLLILLLLGTLSSFAQDRNISGVVTDANSEPLIGANVVVKGTTIGTITDLDGSYSLVLPSKYTTLVVSYVGYLEQEVTVGASNQVNVVLEEDAIGLSEVVITALGTERNAREVVYANQTVSSDELLTTPNKNTIEALRGKTAG
ncbi:MAG: carboxypeptidase-like regulatory domain-containing protein [Chitinophagales bacterium]